MYCEKCGIELINEDRFCPECGNEVNESDDMNNKQNELVLLQNDETKFVRKKKKNKVGILCMAAVAIIALIGCIFFMTTNSKSSQIVKRLELAAHYMEELEYEQALDLYMAVIDIEPSNIDAYLGASDAYVGLERFDEAIEILEKGYDITSSEEIQEKIVEIQDMMSVRQQVAEQEVQIENTEEEIIEKYGNMYVPNEEQREFMEKFKDALEKENGEIIMNCFSDSIYFDMLDQLSTEQHFYYIGEVDDQMHPNGFGMALYADYNFIYIGYWSNGVKKGEGKAFSGFDNMWKRAFSTWSNDKANGKCRLDIYYETGGSEYYEGEVIDNKFDGQVFHHQQNDEGDVLGVNSNEILCNGIYQIQYLDDGTPIYGIYENGGGWFSEEPRVLTFLGEEKLYEDFCY